jgi:hypothetical protein
MLANHSLLPTDLSKTQKLFEYDKTPNLYHAPFHRDDIHE